MSEETETIDDFDEPPILEKKCPLNSQSDVAREMARVYRAMRFRGMSTSRGNGLAHALAIMSKVLTEVANERNLQKLEELESKRVVKAITSGTQSVTTSPH